MNEAQARGGGARRATRSLIDLGTAADACDRRAALNPDDVALVDARSALTWRGVRVRSDRLAALLVEHGASRDGCGVACLPNCVELFLIRLAAEKAGLPLALIPATFGAAEIGAICRGLRPAFACLAPVRGDFDPGRTVAEASGPSLRLLVWVRGAAGGAPPEAPRAARGPAGAGGPSGALVVMGFDDALAAGSAAVEGEPGACAQSRVRPHEAAQLSPTSGSTGTPKCLRTTPYARGLTGCVQAERWELGADDVIAALTPIGSGTADALAYHAAPRFARRIVLVERFRAEDLLPLAERHGVTVVTAVPTMLARLAKSERTGAAGRSSLRVIACYGAPLAEDVARMVEAATGARVVQAFGTSDHGGVAANRLADPPEVRWRSVGRPLWGNELELRGPDGRVVPPGEPGRVFVRGPHLYDADTAGDGPGRPPAWHALDDLARCDPEGNVSVLGRVDDVIIRGGQNIFPGDIEALLLEHPAVAEAAVVGIPEPDLGQRVCACLVARTGATLRDDEVVAFLKARGVAFFKLPERVAVLDALPRSANGLKLNRSALLQQLLAGPGMP